MKQTARWICPLIFLLLCVAVVWFLHTFTVTDKTLQYIDWQSAAQIEVDGTETLFTLDEYTNMPEVNGTFRFTATLPAGLGNGYLLFETSGEELTLSLNGVEIYHSSVFSPQEVLGMAQAHVPLPEDASGKLVLTCTLLDDTNVMFPPLLRFIPDGLTETEAYAYANLFGIPAGAAALALLLTAGLFLLGVTRKQIDWSLIPLFLATVGLVVYRLVQSCGYYFLPESVVNILSWPGFGWLAPLALTVYLAMNRRRDFWRHLGMAAAWSAGALLVGYLISLAAGGYLSDYLNLMVSELFQYGFYDGLLYWVTLWLTVVSALISAYGVMRSFTQQQAKTQALTLKNKLVMDSYHAIERKMRDSAALRHELKHQITAMDALCQKGDYEGLGALLGKLKQQNGRLSQTQFTENFTVNAILQDAASRAAQEGIAFDAQVHVPVELSIPENDLCVLLMNMLDNALEACIQVEKPRKQFIRFKAEVKNNFLAIKCENTYARELKEDKHGRLLTTKAEPESHGFGLMQMSAVAEKYHSLLDASYSDEHVFIAQTALKLPKRSV